MNTLALSIDTYTDLAVDHAILEAIRACNHMVSNSDIISYLLDGVMFGNPMYSNMDRVQKRHLNTRISEKMERYPVANKNSKYTTWRVK